MYDVVHDYTIAREERAGKERDKNVLARDSCGIPGRPENYVSVSRDTRCNFPPFDAATFRRGAEQRPFYGTALRDETHQAERKRAHERVYRTGPSVVVIKRLRGFTIFSFFLSRCRVSTPSSD